MPLPRSPPLSFDCAPALGGAAEFGEVEEMKQIGSKKEIVLKAFFRPEHLEDVDGFALSSFRDREMTFLVPRF